MIYAGIGSRETPKPFLDFMYLVGLHQGKFGHTLRSGNARGADEAFMRGAIEADGRMEIYLPSPRFGAIQDDNFVSTIPEEAFEIAEQFHPKWGNVSDFGKRLMARNSMQVLGMDLKTPADFIICYTHDGKASGGTGQAIRIADAYNIPVFNLKDKEDYALIKSIL